MPRGRIFEMLWLILAGIYVFAAVAAGMGWWGGVRAGINVDFENGIARVTRVDPAGPAWAAGIRQGDRLVAVDGLAPSPEDWSATGDVAASMVFRKPSGHQLTVATDHEAVPGRGAFVGLETTGALFALVSLFVFARPYRPAQVVAFSLFALVAAIAIAAAPGAATGHPLSRVIEATALHWIPVGFVAFVHVFAQNSGPSRGIRLPGWLLALPAAALGLDILTSIETTTAPELHDSVSTTRFAFLAGGLLLGLGMLIRNYVRSESVILREQTRVIAFGTALALLPVVLLSAIPHGAGVGDIVGVETTVIAAAIIPLAFAYAILRHELMGIRRLVHRGVSYVLISVLMLTLYVAAIVTVRAVGGGADVGTRSPLTLTLLIVLVAGVPLVPRVREMAFGTVNRLLYRDFVDHREVVRRVSLQAVETTTVPRLMSPVLSTVSDALGLSCAAYVEREDGLARPVAHVGEADEEFTESLRTLALRNDNSASLTKMDPGGTREGECLFAPISGGSSSPGVLALGPKATGEPFSEDDLQMVQTIAGLVSTAVARLRLVDELKDKNIELVGLNARLMEVEEQERARLSAYLHDEPLQKVTYVLSQHRERQLDQDLASILGDVARELRTISTSLSPALLADLGLIPALEWLVSEVKERADFRIDFQHTGLTSEQRLPSAVELVAYRVAQEALTNCQKHSSAAAVWVSLELDVGVLRVSVEDNGEGLARPDRQHRRLPEHLGLVGMRQRVESQNGRLVVENRKSRGVRVAAYLPLGGAPTRTAEIDPDR